MPNQIIQYPEHATCPAESQCTLWMATSTIPNSGLGVFTTAALEEGDVIGLGDVMNPWIDLPWHQILLMEDHPFKNHVWQGYDTSFSVELSAYQDVLWMGSGLEATINCHLALVNTYSATIYNNNNNPQHHRSRDPGAGSFSPFVAGATVVANPVPEGGELFKMYSSQWFRTRQDEFGVEIPLPEDYVQADTLIQKFGKLFPQAHHTLQTIHKDLWDVMTSMPYPITKALPKRHKDIPLVIQHGIWEAYLMDAKRPPEELERTGRCLENIRHGPSMLPQAGRGAFATRHLAAGTVITGSPLVYVENRHIFHMYQEIYDALMNEQQPQSHDIIESTLQHPETVRTLQIAINYCWNHPSSPMLLCPYGAGVNFVNHNQTMANVKVRWAPHGEVGHDASLLKGPLSDVHNPTLAFDFVALRDIDVGEELFLDYGKEWEMAWQEHVQAFGPPKSTGGGVDPYQSAWQWNQENENSDTAIRTDYEQKANPYPINLQLRCHQDLRNDWEVTNAVGELRNYSWTMYDKGTPCQVLDRYSIHQTEQPVYTVGVDRHGPSCVQVENVPRSALRFFDVPYSTDLHLPGAFRHAIGIPDELFPLAWKAAT